ncbi:MAG: endonuclease/exonuclease/phosphatase family protein [Phenylobacterium sp.]|uniref:endonuclease/exonuclease/phosphatase family protein n=1 Tax=Phenylobacterium sp. TaxID=1871053 RepID=UPI00391C9A71
MGFLQALAGSFVYAFGALCAAASLAAHGGRWSVRLDVLTHFAPIWFAGGALALAFALASPHGFGRTLGGFAGLLAVVAAGALILPEVTRPESPRAPADAPRQLKLIQFNTWGRNVDPQGAARWILEQDPDLVVLQESTGPIVARLRKAGFHTACGDCSVVILSRAKPVVTDTPVDRAPGPRAPTARATFAEADGGHTVVATHYIWPTYGDAQQRQGERLARILDRLPKSRLILSGDFNSTPWSFSRRAEDARFGLERRTRAFFSWPAAEFTRRRIPAPFPFLPIDHVYAGPDWKTVSVERGPRLGSDHYPVIVTLALDPAKSLSRVAGRRGNPAS